jgi:hypothetical protein
MAKGTIQGQALSTGPGGFHSEDPKSARKLAEQEYLAAFQLASSGDTNDTMWMSSSAGIQTRSRVCHLQFGKHLAATSRAVGGV